MLPVNKQVLRCSTAVKPAKKVMFAEISIAAMGMLSLGKQTSSWSPGAHNTVIYRMVGPEELDLPEHRIHQVVSFAMTSMATRAMSQIY